MTTLPHPQRQSRLRFGWLRAVLTGLALAALWWLIAGTPESWVVGGPTVLAGAGLVGSLPRSGGTIRLHKLPGFVVWFLWESVLSGTDVAIRALRPGPPIAPGTAVHVTTLTGAGRVMLANTVTVLPGTLTMHINADRLEIHVLDSRLPIDDEIRALERRIAGLVRDPAPVVDAI